METESRYKILSIPVKPEISRQIRAIAGAKNQTLSAFCREVLVKAINEYQKSQA